MRAAFDDQARAAGLEGIVFFLGIRTDVSGLLSCCDVGVLASLAEGLPNAVLEYMASGLPTVATSVGGVPEIIENEVSGLLVPPGNPAALAHAILRLVNDEELRGRLAKAGRERMLAKFDFGRVVEEVTQLYEGHSRAGAIPGGLRETLQVQ